MRRVGSAWVPDGRAKAVRADCEASLASLDGLPIDLYLTHAPDPRTPWRTSVRALARLVDEQLVRRVGVSNVNRLQLDEALELAPIAAVEISLSLLDDRAIRGGVVERCREAGIALIAHSPLGGPRRAAGLARRRGARRDRAPARRASGGGRARLAPRSRARRRRDPGRPAPGDRAVGRPCRDARVERRGPGAPGGRVRAPSPRPLDALEDPGRHGRRPGDGHSRRGQEPGRGGARRARLRPAEPRRARRHAPGARRRARRDARVRRDSGGARQHVPHARGEARRRRRSRPARRERPLHLDRRAAGAGAGEPRRAAARSVRTAPDPGRAPRVTDAASRACSRRRPRCARCASSSRRRTTRDSPPSSGSRSRGHRRRRRHAAPSSSPPPRCASRDGRTPSRRPIRPLHTSSSTGARTDRPPTSRRPSPSCRPSWPLPSRPSAPTAAAPRSAGAARRFPGCSSRLPARTDVDPGRSTLVGTSAAHRTLATTLGARYVEP